MYRHGSFSISLHSDSLLCTLLDSECLLRLLVEGHAPTAGLLPGHRLDGSLSDLHDLPHHLMNNGRESCDELRGYSLPDLLLHHDDLAGSLLDCHHLSSRPMHPDGLGEVLPLSKGLCSGLYRMRPNEGLSRGLVKNLCGGCMLPCH